ncbi:MAG: zeta toxin family protein [Vicinamibacterales bacterium]
MSEPRPSVVILAGPNGAGKSTAAPALLQGALQVNEFVNADVIARGLSAFDPDSAAIAAGRVMLARLHELAAQRVSFAFETTLASRTFAPWFAGLKVSGYDIHLVFLWLSSADLALERVADRVRNGGHDIPSDVVRRRYSAGVRNFFHLYQQVATSWAMYNASGPQPLLLAEGLELQPERVYDIDVWAAIRQQDRR